MRNARVVTQSPHLVVRDVRCADDHRGWSGSEWSAAAQIVLVRRGRFRRQSHGEALTVDSTTGYMHGPGQEQRFSHPAGGDACTSITFVGNALLDDPWVWSAISNASSAVRVDARTELAHRRLVSSRSDPDVGAAEAVLDLLSSSVQTAFGVTTPAPGRRELAERARDAIVADVPASARLVDLARLLDTSAAHLSRTFRHHVGSTISRYRNRVRVSRALDQIEDGEIDLAHLAHSLGFSDQAHFTRVVRHALGYTPQQVMNLLECVPE